MAEPKIHARASEKVIYWNIGQGDFISYVGSSVCLIFDVGGSFKIPQKDLMLLRRECPSRTVELYVSHFDKDHIVNFQRLMTYVFVSTAYFSHLDPSTQLGRKFLEQLKFQNAKIIQIRAGFSKSYGTVQLKCLWPLPGVLSKSENDRSLVLDLKVHSRSFLFTGDLPSKMEKKFSPGLSRILKAGHHGSRWSSSQKFLEAIHPSLCIVSVGAYNHYGHPNSEALKRMVEAHCAILRTDKLGDITIEI